MIFLSFIGALYNTDYILAIFNLEVVKWTIQLLNLIYHQNFQLLV